MFTIDILRTNDGRVTQKFIPNLLEGAALLGTPIVRDDVGVSTVNLAPNGID
jgi:hypothetical protein